MDPQSTPSDQSSVTDAVTTFERDFETAQKRAFDAAGVTVASRYVDLDPPYGRIHILEAGDHTDEPPLLFVHGMMTFGAMFAPLMGRIERRHQLALDRPGWGLSDDYRYDAATHRQTAIDVLEGVLDGLDIDQVDLVGHSTGGYWGLVLALAHPERVRRLITLGGIPAFPGTSPPIRLRLFTVPLLARVLAPRGHPTAEPVLEQLSTATEKNSIRRYPKLVATRMAHERTPGALRVGVSELRSFMSLRDWRPGMQLTRMNVQSIQQPTTVIWGDNDLFGAPMAVRRHVASMPVVRFETLDTGHIPWLGYPDACADLISTG